MIGRLPPEAAATPSEHRDRRARLSGLAIVASGLLAIAGAVGIGGKALQAELGVSARVVTACSADTMSFPEAGADLAAPGTACSAQRETRAQANTRSSNDAADRDDRVTTYVY